MRFHKLEEEAASERFDLTTTGHVDTARSQWGHQTKVGPCQGEEGMKEGLLNPVVHSSVHKQAITVNSTL